MLQLKKMTKLQFLAIFLANQISIFLLQTQEIARWEKEFIAHKKLQKI